MILTSKDGRGGAIFSPCQKYRYALWRDLPKGEGSFVVLGLNPSTADHEQLDPTCKRLLKRAEKAGCNRYVMLNVFAFRATDPKVMFRQPDPIGPDNDEYIKFLTKGAKIIVAAWGADVDRRRAEAVCKLIAKPLMCLGRTKDGSPRHPLYVGYSVGLQEFWP